MNYMRMQIAAGLLLIVSNASAGESDERYIIQPGDVLIVSVWRESELQGEVLVLPDGGLSFPLVGTLSARGKTVEQLREEMVERLKRYLPDPVVTVAAKSIAGNRIYVIGKVNRPGDFPLGRPIDVMQAIALAGGANAFADLNDIVILRRENSGQVAIRFRYPDVESGRALDQNILLRSGDTVVVP
jgi:polysaccharide export outer membrane protein